MNCTDCGAAIDWPDTPKTALAGAFHALLSRHALCTPCDASNRAKMAEKAAMRRLELIRERLRHQPDDGRASTFADFARAYSAAAPWRNIILCGPTTRSKTWSAHEVACKEAHAGASVSILSAAMVSIYARGHSSAMQDVLDDLRGSLIIADDFDKSLTGEKSTAAFLDILNEIDPQRRRKIIGTSNLTGKQIKERFGSRADWNTHIQPLMARINGGKTAIVISEEQTK